MSLRRALLAAGIVAAVLLAPTAAWAHPLGNFTVNTSANLVLSPGIVRVDYVVDFAEIPTVQVRHDLDADDDGLATDAERAAWATGTAAQIVANLSLAVDGDEVALTVEDATAELLPGQGGLDVLRLEVAATGQTDAAGAIEFADANFEEHVGWREVVATGVDGVAVTGSSVPAESPTDRLRTYPEDLLSSPLDVREATFAFSPGTSGPAAVSGDSDETATVRPGIAGGAFAGLVGRTGPLMVVALVLAFGFGALHALGPGHGKTLMAAYLVGSGGRLRQAVAVGGAVAIMHTASVLALGFVVLTATETFAPERVYPWLSIGSGLIALGLGAALLVSRLGAWSAHHHHDDHDHDHGHAHPQRSVLSRRGLVALAAAGGILPSPTALVVLLAAVALHRAIYGLALIGAFSLGLATALVIVGVAAMQARDVVARRMSSRLARLVPLASASAIVLLGAALAVGGVAGL